MSLPQTKRKTVLRNGRIIWIALFCASFLAGNRLAMLTGKKVAEQAVLRWTETICELAGYARRERAERVWQEDLWDVLTTPIPFFFFCEGREEKSVTTVTDPVYDRYQSSEIVFGGGILTLPETPARPEEEDPGETETNTPEAGFVPETGEEPDEEYVSHLPVIANGTCYTLEQLRNFSYLVNRLYFVHDSTTVYPSQLNIDTLLEKDLTIKREGGAQILIHHTHGTEGFSDSGTGGGKTILEVGDYLTGLLEEYGYTVIHDRTIYPYDTAYSEAQVRVKKILAENPSIQIVIDLHRDATASQEHRIVTVHGETMAPLMFFNGMCQTPDGPIDYLSNPYLEDNLALSLQMKLVAEAYYPGLTRPNFLKAYQYNQHLLPRYTLIEAGFDTNTFDEVCRSMVPLANILDAVLSDPGAVVLREE